MSFSSNRIFKNTALLYVRQLLTLGLSLYTSRLTLRVLGETDFGIYAAVAGVTAFMSLLTNMMSASTQRFMTFELGRGDMEKAQRVYSTSTLLYIVISVLFLCVAEPLGVWFVNNVMTIPPERLAVANWLFQFSLLSFVLGLLTIPNQASVIAHEDMGAFGFFSVAEAVLKLGCVACLFYLPWDALWSYGLLLLLTQAAIRVLYWSFCRRRYSEDRFSFSWDKDLAKSMVGFAGYSAVSTVATTSFIQGVNILLNLFFGPVLNAAYTIAMQVYSGLRSFTSNFQLASNPQIVKLFSQGRVDDMHSLLVMTCKLSFFLVFTLSLPFFVSAEWVMETWLDDVPAHSVNFLRLMLLYAYFDIYAYPLDVAAQATGNIKRYTLLSALPTFLILPVTYLLYYKGHVPEYVYYVAVVFSFVGFFCRVVSLRKIVSLPVFWFVKTVLLRPVVAASFSFAIVAAFFSVDSVWMFAACCLCTLCVCCASFYWVALRADERQEVRNMAGTALKKIGGRR